MSLKDKITSYKEKESKFEEFKKQFGEILEKANELREIAMEKCGKLAFNRTTGIAALSILAISIGCGIGTQMYKDYMRKNGPITPTYSLSENMEMKLRSEENEKQFEEMLEGEDITSNKDAEEISDELLEKIANDTKKDLTEEEVKNAVDIGVER